MRIVSADTVWKPMTCVASAQTIAGGCLLAKAPRPGSEAVIRVLNNFTTIAFSAKRIWIGLSDRDGDRRGARAAFRPVLAAGEVHRA